MYKIEEIRSWPLEDGWFFRPGGWTKIKVAESAIVSDSVQIGNGAKIGDRAEIGDYAKIGNFAKIGDDAEVGNDAKIGSCAQIGDYVIVVAGVILPMINIHGYTSNIYAPGTIRVGCEIHSIWYWRRHLRDVMASHDIDIQHEQTIRDRINYLNQWVKYYPNQILLKEQHE